MQQYYNCLRSSIILTYAAALLMHACIIIILSYTQQHYTYLGSSIAYAAVLYLFMEQCCTYLRSSIAYAAESAFSIILIYTAALYLFAQQCYTDLRSSVILIYAAVLYLFMQQYYTRSVTVALFYLLHSVTVFVQRYYLCRRHTYAAVLYIITPPYDSCGSIMLQQLPTFIVTVIPLVALRPQLPLGLSIETIYK